MHYVFVTGSSRGIGKAIVDRFLTQDNVQVFGMSRSKQEARNNFHPISINLSSEKELLDFEFPKLPQPTRVSLINNAGSIDPIKPIGKLDNEQTLNTLRLNLAAPLVLSNKFVQAFADDNYPCTIANISSGAAFRPIDAWSVYCTSKAGLEMFGECISEELDNKMRFLSISPGVVDTKMQAEIRSTDPDDFKLLDRFKGFHESGDLRDPKWVADQVYQLLMDDSKLGPVRL